MKAINAIRMGGIDVLPWIEGGKGVSTSNGISSGNWAVADGVGMFCVVNTDSVNTFADRIKQGSGPGDRERGERCNHQPEQAAD